MMMVEILSRQKEEVERVLSSKIVPRELAGALAKELKKPICKVVTGVRRSGKSFLSFLLLRNLDFGYVNFDERALLKTDLDALLSAVNEVYGRPEILLLDEIQNIDGWELWVNALQRLGYNLVITGSNARLLSRELATHLTGRYLEFEVFPFSFREFLFLKGGAPERPPLSRERRGALNRLLREYLAKGGFPEYLVKELSADYLQTLLSSVIYKEVVQRYRVKAPREIEDLALHLLANFSAEYSFNKLRNLLGLRSVVTVKKYVGYLEEAFLLFSLPRYSEKTREIIKAPRKAYSVDLGLSSVVSPKLSEDMGRAMENCVFLQLRRMGLKEGVRLFYWRDHQQREVDFVVKRGAAIECLIQVTYASGKDEINRREVDALVRAGGSLNCRRLQLITWDYAGDIRFRGRRISCVPLWRWLLFGRGGARGRGEVGEGQAQGR
jgi:hypothetical protein